MKVISGLLPESWGYFCIKNFISATRNCHIFTKAHILFCLPCSRYTLVFFPRLACGPPKLMSLGAPPRLTPSQWVCVLLMKQKPLALLEHPFLPIFVSANSVAQSLPFGCVMLYRPLFIFCSFLFVHFIICA